MLPLHTCPGNSTRKRIGNVVRTRNAEEYKLNSSWATGPHRGGPDKGPSLERLVIAHGEARPQCTHPCGNVVHWCEVSASLTSTTFSPRECGPYENFSMGPRALTWAFNNPARLLIDSATRRCSGPSAFSLMACDRSKSCSASVYLPCHAVVHSVAVASIAQSKRGSQLLWTINFLKPLSQPRSPVGRALLLAESLLSYA